MQISYDDPGYAPIEATLSEIESIRQNCPQTSFGIGGTRHGGNLFFPISLPVRRGTDNCCDLPMKFRPVIAIFAALVATSFAMDQPSFHTKGAPTGKPSGPLKPGEYWWKP